MRFRDAVQLALRDLRRRKLRAALTILGVVIGTVILTIGIVSRWPRRDWRRKCH